MTDSRPEPTLTDCDREPIHVPGSIQAHGSLLALDDARHVVAWSADLDAEIEAGGTRATLADVVGTAGAQRIDPIIEQRQSRPILPVPVPAIDRKALVHRNPQGWTIVELERLELDYEDLAGVLHRTQESTQQLTGMDDTEELARALASIVRELTGFDRVMVYRFAEDWHGWVVAEDRADEVDSYLGVHVPASDIPAQARALYTRNPLRLIADVGAAPIPLRTRHPALQSHTLDLSDAVLRSVSPIHIQYLENMDVGGSMSISLLRGGELWGMVACHHRGPRHVSFEVRQACELIGRFVSRHIELRGELERSRAQARTREHVQRLAEGLVPEADLGASLVDAADDLAALVDADGFAVVGADRITLRGIDASTGAFVEWVQRLPLHEASGPWGRDPDGPIPPPPVEPDMVGVLALRAGDDPATSLVWLRREEVETVRWAGDPNKPVVTAADGTRRLHPRESFAAWIEERRGRARPWQPWELEAVGELGDLILSPAVRAAFALRAQSEELERFAFVASHDLRAPLRAVENIAQWLVEDEGPRLSEDARSHLDLLTSRVGRMDRMLVDLLAYSRAGREKVPSERVDLDELAREVFEGLAVPPNFEVRIDAPMPVVVGPRAPLRQILWNLISNAVKHHDRADGTVQASAHHENGMLRVTVVDDGPGIPAQHRDRVFGMFTKLESRDRVEGSGMGLALVRRYARHLGGDATVAPGSGRGTRIDVDLGLEAADE